MGICLKFGRNNRHSGGNVEQAGKYIHLEFRAEFWAEEVHLRLESHQQIANT